jgi:hypothetical protein
MTNSHLRLVAPRTVNCTVTPRRPPNADLRTREHLTQDEVERLIEAAKANRHGHRDALMVLLAYRHGLRAAEVVDLRLGAGRLQRRNSVLFQAVSCGRCASTSAKAPARPSCSSHSTDCAGLLENGRTRGRGDRARHQGPCPHAAARLWLQVSQRWA